MEIRHLLAPTDFSAPANQAMTYVFELAQTFGAKLSRLHGIEVPADTIEVALPLAELEWDARRVLALRLPEADAAHVEVTRLVAPGVLAQRSLDTPAFVIGSWGASPSAWCPSPGPRLTTWPPGKRGVGERPRVR